MSKRTTIFKQLILNVVFPAIIALLALGVLNLRQTYSILRDAADNNSRIISEEIRQIHELQDMATMILEDGINPKLRQYSGELVDKIFLNTDNIEGADLATIREQIGMDPAYEDIYVINREGVIVNSTFEKDLGFNLFSLGEEHKNLLDSIWTNKVFLSDVFTIENNTRRLRKYTYQPTRDGRYIIELGLYSPKADSIIDFVRERINDISKEQKNVVSVQLFFGAENPIALNGTGTLLPEHLGIYREVMRNHERRTDEREVDGTPLRYDFIYMQRQNTSLYKESVIRIIYDVSSEHRLKQNEMIKFLAVFGLTILVVVIMLSRKTRVITDPIKKLVINVNRITEGHLNERAEVNGNNEIASLSEKFNNMIEQLESYYNELEEKVRERTAEVVAQKEEIEAQRDMLASFNASLQKAYTEIEDSIHYARRIQNAILPPENYLKKVLPNAFFYYKPRDIVSGDFYWVAAKDNKVIVAAVDCTGHGVPGAFMSIVGSNQLNYALNVMNVTQPSEILSILDDGVAATLRQSQNLTVHDGMDLAVITIDAPNNILEFAGAYNPLILVRDNELIKYKADRIPIGGHNITGKKEFTNQKLEIRDGDMAYIFTDGFADQFGGPDDSKFMSRKFLNLLQEIASLPVEKQAEQLEKAHIEWRGDEPQVDDILVIGIRL